jgi:hypothetical protein
MAWSGESVQTGLAGLASPASRKACQRQPPQSISRRSQLRQGSAIQSVPRKRLKASERYQMSARLLSRTDGKAIPGSVSAAWQGTDLPGRRDVQELAAPAVHAGFRPHSIIVRHDIVDGQYAFQLFARRLDGAGRLIELAAAGQQRTAILERPGVILRNLDPPGAQRQRHVDHLGHAGEVLAMDHHVQRERQAYDPDGGGELDLLGMCAGEAGDAVTPQAYQPSFDDLMTISIQPGHIKRGLAGRERNWTGASKNVVPSSLSLGKFSRHLSNLRPVTRKRQSFSKDPPSSYCQTFDAGDRSERSTFQRRCRTCRQYQARVGNSAQATVRMNA